MADKVITSTGDCSACCTPTPTDCACALFIPPFASPYADYATAAADIAAYVTDCIMYAGTGAGYPFGFPLDTATISIVGPVVTVHLATSAELLDTAYIGLTLKSGETIALAGAYSCDGIPDPDGRPASFFATLFPCDGSGGVGDSVTGSDSNNAVGSFILTAPADGVYYLYASSRGGGIGSTSSDFAFTLTMSDVFTANPVIAQWDDSATTRQLEACPKMYLPPLTEITGDWYADCAAAATALGNTDSCDGYYETNAPADTGFTSSVGGGNVNLLMTASVPNPGFAPVITSYLGLTLEAGESLTMGYTIPVLEPSKAEDIGIYLYDDAGGLIASHTLTSSLGGTDTGNFTFTSLPYTGKYILKFTLTGYVTDPGPGGEVSGYGEVSWTGTSTGLLGGVLLQALYDVGLDCPGRLDCGDTC